jgi:enoyl-CoA hydratase/carnithine racemase
MPQEITVSRIGCAVHIRLDRAGKRNAITRSMYDAMAEAIVEAEADETIRAVLFSGAGEAFCAGNLLPIPRPAWTARVSGSCARSQRRRRC